MRDLDTLEAKVKYAKQLASSIKARQQIVGSKLELVESFTAQLSRTVSAFQEISFRVIFTPNGGVNGYAEMGFADNNNPNLVSKTYSDPDYATSATQQSWIIYYANFGSATETVNISASVISLPGGSATIGVV